MSQFLDWQQHAASFEELAAWSGTSRPDVYTVSGRGTPERVNGLRTTERLRRTDFGHMEIQFTFDDPKTYTKPWSVTVPFELLPDTEIIENICENELDQQRLKGIRP